MLDDQLNMSEAEELELHRTLFRAYDRVGFNVGPVEFCSACLAAMRGQPFEKAGAKRLVVTLAVGGGMPEVARGVDETLHILSFIVCQVFQFERPIQAERWPASRPNGSAIPRYHRRARPCHRSQMAWRGPTRRRRMAPSNLQKAHRFSDRFCNVQRLRSFARR